MTIIGDRFIAAATLSEGWSDAVRCVAAVPSRKVVHLAIRIGEPATEDADVRRVAQRVIDEVNSTRQPKFQLYDVTTTRNSIFPVAWARRTSGPEALAAYYRARYTREGIRAFPNNARGTYFGRIVAYPNGSEQPLDQLSETVRKLRQETAGPAPKSSRYEINIYSAAVDTSPMSFPCLSHISLHLHEGHLHMQALYRNEYLIARAYGNYLGLAQLHAYIAAAANVVQGELLITVNHAELDLAKRQIDELIRCLARE